MNRPSTATQDLAADAGRLEAWQLQGLDLRRRQRVTLQEKAGQQPPRGHYLALTYRADQSCGPGNADRGVAHTLGPTVQTYRRG